MPACRIRMGGPPSASAGASPDAAVATLLAPAARPRVRPHAGIASATGLARSAGVATGNPAYPPTVNPLTFRSTPSQPGLSYLGLYTDTDLGSKTRRIGERATERHNYASQIAFNANMTLCNLGYASPNRGMVRVSDWVRLVDEQGNTSTLNFYNQDPTKAWCVNGSAGGIRKLNVNNVSGVVSVATTYGTTSFARPGGGTYGGGSMNPGGFQGCQSDDDRWLAYFWKASDNDWGIGIFDLLNGVIHAERTMGNSASALSSLIDNCGTSHSGDWAWFTFIPDGTAATQGMWLYERDLNTTTRRQASTSQEHCDWVRHSDGTDRFVFWNGNIRSMVPSTGTTITLQSNVPGGTHISGRAWQFPGWVLVSQHQVGFTNPGAGVVFYVRTDGSGDCIEMGRNFKTSDVGYAGEVHACPSPDGTIVVAACNMGGSTVYAYAMGVNV